MILVNPKKPDFCDFKYLYTSFVLGPLTSDFFINGNSTPWFKEQNSAIAWSVPDSCPPNFPQGSQKSTGQVGRKGGRCLVTRESDNNEVFPFVFRI